MDGQKLMNHIQTDRQTDFSVFGHHLSRWREDSGCVIQPTFTLLRHRTLSSTINTHTESQTQHTYSGSSSPSKLGVQCSKVLVVF